jgi:uncharacterized membrane protein
MMHQNSKTPERIKGIVWPLWIVVVAMLALAVIAFPSLPDPIPTHWGFDGQPNDWGSRWTIFLMPGMAALFTFLFSLFERIDPKRINYRAFQKAWFAIRFGIILFLGFIEAVMIYVALNPEYNDKVGVLVTAGVGILLIVFGNYMGKIRQNWFVGLRTPWTLDDPEVWQKSQRVAGWAFVVAGIAILIMALTGGLNPWIFFLIVFCSAFAPVFYSYFLYKKKHAGEKPKER